MDLRPSVSEIKELAKKYRTIPVSAQIRLDLTPQAAIKKLKKISSHCYMLESCEDRQRWGRYTFLGYDPKLEITCKNYEIRITDEYGVKRIKGTPQKYVCDILERHNSPSLPYLPTFTGGLVGYFGYDYAKYAEPRLSLDAEDDSHFNDMDLMLFDKVIAFDNQNSGIFLICNMQTDKVEENYARAVKEIEIMLDVLKNGEEADIEMPKLRSPFRPLFNADEYGKMVEKAKHYIKEGDIFQIVLSNLLYAPFKGSLLNTYRVLRTTNPSPYMFYFCGTDVEVAGASPETLVKLENGILHTFPLAGTRKRGKNETEDKQLEIELLNDEKELAEHNMLVDLGRNDIGKISKFGTVKVEKLHSIERYSHVMHIGSTVKGEISENYDALDAINAVLPAGTLSGAPKIRACQLISELEQNKRGIYGGAIGYIDFSGNMDTCIAIRIAYKKNDKVFVRSGAGIVADSNPENEYQECINKAMAVVNALKQEID